MNFSHISNTHVGLGAGLLGGLGRYLMEIPLHISFGTAIYHAIIIAIISSLCGLIVKDVYGWIKEKIKK